MYIFLYIQVGKSHSYLSHSACIWGIEMCPPTNNVDKSVFPEGSFITCSSDDTMRVWNMDPSMPNNTSYKKNIYSEVRSLNPYCVVVA